MGDSASGPWRSPLAGVVVSAKQVRWDICRLGLCKWRNLSLSPYRATLCCNGKVSVRSTQYFLAQLKETKM